MGWSLEVEAATTHSPDENLQFLREISHIVYTPVASQLVTSDLAQHLRLEVQEEDMSADLERDLRARGFIRIASHGCMLLDLAPFEGLDQFVASRGRKHRQQLQQGEARFREMGGVTKLLPLGELEPSSLDELYLKMVLPTCSALGVNPSLRVATREGFTQMLSTGDTADLFAMILEINRTPVAVGILTIREGIAASEGSANGTVRSWVREVDDGERVLEFLIIAHAEGEHDLSSLLYSRTIQFAVENGCTLWSGGEDGGTCAGKYLGVRAAKRRWGAAPFLVFNPPHIFFRLSQRKCLQENLDIETSDRGEPAAAQVFVIVNRSERNRLLLAAAAKSMPVRVITLSERDADYWRRELEKHGNEHGVTVQSFPPL